MLMNLNKICVLLFSCIFISCGSSENITITKLEGSPKYENSKISSVNATKNDSIYSFSFEIENYELGAQTINSVNNDLANSAKGQHIHFIVNNGPYSAHYNQDFSADVKDGDVVLAFLSRSYHESVKNPNAYFLTQFGENQSYDLTNEFLFYSRPKGTYKGNDTKKLLLDFYLVNTDISPTGNKVKATINDVVFLIDEWTPYYIEGLPLGEISIKLELVNNDGVLIETPFTPSERTVILE